MTTSTLPKYEVLDTKDEKDTARVMICDGKYEAFLYKYGVVKVEEISEDDGAALTFEYDLIEAPEDYQTEDEDAEKIEFETLIGDILVDIVTKAAEEDHGYRLDDSLKPDAK
jgi:hypothetical protein